MTQLFANNITVVLALDVNNASTSITLNDASLMPSPTGGDFFLLTLIGLNTNGNESVWEIVKCTSRSGNVLTVVRAQEGTTANAWFSGARAELRLTAGSLLSMSSHLTSASNPHGVTAAQSGAEPAGAVAAAVSAHVANANPHSQYQSTSGKDATGGYPGLTLYKINFKNAANTFTSFLANAATASRTYTFKDADGTVAFTSDITGTNSGINTGDNAANSSYANDYRVGNFVAGTNYVAPGGALGTPSSGVVTNLTGTASININGTVGGTTPSMGRFTTTESSGSSTALVHLNPRSITADLTIPSAYNAASVGPITISEGITVTVWENATWSIS